MKIKRISNGLYENTWTRQKSISESQSSKSLLGTLSEKIIKNLFQSFLNSDSTNSEFSSDFFKVDERYSQSYGDFVLMCLPNNLWISVKSSFTRERMLVSGFSTDIVGVGYFEDYKEFISPSKIRNYQKAGFLALYIPDSPVNASQIEQGVTTFNLVKNHYETHMNQWPLNINGTEFLRPSSQLKRDLESLLAQKDIAKRSIVNY